MCIYIHQSSLKTRELNSAVFFKTWLVFVQYVRQAAYCKEQKKENKKVIQIISFGLNNKRTPNGNSSTSQEGLLFTPPSITTSWQMGSVQATTDAKFSASAAVCPCHSGREDREWPEPTAPRSSLAHCEGNSWG